MQNAMPVLQPGFAASLELFPSFQPVAQLRASPGHRGKSL
jgi:hypothetical protein